MMHPIRKFVLLIVVGVLPAVGGAFLPLTMGGDRAIAQENSRKPQTRKSEVLGKAAFEKIEQAQNLLGEDKHDEAVAVLQGLIDSSKYKPYEKAVALQTMGFVYADKGDYTRTMQIFERAIATGDLPPRIVNDLTYNLAQLNLAEGKNQKALDLLNRWFATVEGEPAADAYGLLAQIHMIMEDYPKAEVAIRKALSKSEEPKKTWIRILASILLNGERFKEAKPVLEDAVLRWPDEKAFWQQISAVYYELNQEEMAFVAQQAMYVQGMLTTSKELTRMAQLFMYYDVPIKAAVILEDGLKNGKIEKTEKNYELLANAYMHSREWGKSIAPLKIAADKSEKGKLYLQLGQSYLQDEKWSDAEKALSEALKKGDLDDEGRTWLLLGITRTKLEKWEPAIKAFRKAGDDDNVAKDAFRWIRSVERRLAEIRREKEEAEAQQKG
jgi:tetratricopeptide (TPR) repeat protein